MWITHDFTKDYEYMTNRIFKEKKPTAFSRYNEGERWLLSREGFVWAYGYRRTHGDKRSLSNALSECLTRDEEWYIYWIPSLQHEKESEYFKSIITWPYTFATLRVGNNRKNFKPLLESLKEELVLVVNVKWKWKKYPFPVKERYYVPFDVVTYFEFNRDIIDGQCMDIAKNNNCLVLISAGPLANYIVDKCWQLNKSNRYIDVGSTLDIRTMWRITRNYHKTNHPFYNKIDIL